MSSIRFVYMEHTKSSYCFNFLGSGFNRPLCLVSLGIILLLSCLSGYFFVEFTKQQILAVDSLNTNISSLISSYIYLVLLNLITESALSVLVGRIQRNIVSNHFQSSLLLKYSSFMKITPNAIHHAIIRRSQAFADLCGIIFANLLQNTWVLMLTLLSIRSCFHSPRVVMEAAGGLLMYFILSAYFRIKSASLRRKINSNNSVNSAKCLDILSNHERVIAFDNTDTELKKYGDILSDEVFNNKIYEVSYVFMDLCNNLAAIFLVYYFLKKHSSISKGSHLLVLLLARFQDTVNALSYDLDGTLISLSNLVPLQMKPDDYEPIRHPKYFPHTFKSSIVLEDVKYSENGKYIINGISCSFLAGTKTAIVGPIGSGKTTLLRLILRIIDYSSGIISLNGMNIRDISRPAYSMLLSYSPQSKLVFNEPVINNLVSVEKYLSLNKIVSKCKMYGFWEELCKIGFRSVVGEFGKNLSGGQCRRLIVMRALIRDSLVLLLDKPTEGMDLMSASDFEKNVLFSSQDITFICVVDSLKNLELYDQVLYMEEGKIVEQGDMQELLKSNGPFKRFYIDTLG